MLMKISRVRGGFVGVLRSSQTPEWIIATTATPRPTRNDAAKDSCALLTLLRYQK
jgi:hypothetical protein